MTPDRFVFFMNSFVCGMGGVTPTPDQWAEIKRELAAVKEDLAALRVAPIPNPSLTGFPLVWPQSVETRRTWGTGDAIHIDDRLPPVMTCAN